MSDFYYNPEINYAMASDLEIIDPHWPIELDLDETCEDCRSAGYTVINGLIATYHAWHISLDGCADDEIYGDQYIARVGNSFVTESDSGFVYGTHYDSAIEADQAWDALQDEYSVYPADDFDGDDQDRHERDQELLQDAGE